MAPTYGASERSASARAASSSLGSCVSTATNVARSMPPTRPNASSGHAAITSSASGKRSRVANCERGSQTNGRQPAERRGIVHRAEDHEPWRRRGHVDEERHLAVAHRLRALLPEQILGRLDGHAIELEVAETSLGGAVRSDQELRARLAARNHGHERGATVLAGDARELPMSAQSTYSSTKTSISPPQGRPTSHASLSAIPKCRSLGRPSSRTSAAASTTAPSTHPPETAPETCPCSFTAILAPGGRGAERLTATTVATATRSPFAVQASTSSSTSFTACLSSLRSLPRRDSSKASLHQ